MYSFGEQRIVHADLEDMEAARRGEEVLPRRLEDLGHALYQRQESGAALTVSVASFAGDIDLTVRMRTAAQLRPPANTWEVAWLVWHSDEDFSNGNYLLLKETGLEVGRTNDRGWEEQTFFYTDEPPDPGKPPIYVIGQTYLVRVWVVGTRIQVWVDDDPVPKAGQATTSRWTRTCRRTSWAP